MPFSAIVYNVYQQVPVRERHWRSGPLLCTQCFPFRPSSPVIILENTDLIYSSNSSTLAPAIGNEFTGLTLRIDEVFRRIQFTLEHMGQFAIAALKEEALLEYNEPLIDFDFKDHDRPGPPLRIMIQAETPYILHAKVRRSTVMWAIGAVAVNMMRNLYLYPLTFRVMYYTEHIYSGSITVQSNNNAIPAKSSGNASSLASKVLPTPFSLAVVPINSTNKSLLTKSANIRDDPRFDLAFTYSHQRGSLLGDYHILRALIATMLQIAKADALSTQLRIGMTRRDLQAWVFMEDVNARRAAQHFYQYQAVAVLEAIAIYDQLHAQYREVMFELRASGQLLAIGCVARGVSTRQWCRGLASGEDDAAAESRDQVAAIS